MKKLLALIAFLIPLSLSGCIPLVIVAGAASGAAIVTDKRSMSTILADRHAAQTAQNKINEDTALAKRSHISVAVFNHIALLVGQAQTPELRARAYRYVMNTKGIQRVYNEIQIKGSTSWIQRSNDSWLTSKVKTSMIAEKGLRSSQIKIVTEDNVVYLMGLVTRPEARLAANVARRVEGVTKVVTVFQYQGGKP